MGVSAHPTSVPMSHSAPSIGTHSAPSSDTLVTPSATATVSTNPPGYKMEPTVKHDSDIKMRHDPHLNWRKKKSYDHCHHNHHNYDRRRTQACIILAQCQPPLVSCRNNFDYRSLHQINHVSIHNLNIRITNSHPTNVKASIIIIYSWSWYSWW